MRVFLYPSPLHYRIIPEMIYSSNATMLFGTDTFLSGYAAHAHPYDLFSIRYVFAAAEKLKEETKRVYTEKFGLRILEAYGATEAGPAISVNTPMHSKSSTVGRVLPSIEYYLEPMKGIEKGGRLIVKGPNIMLGYLKNDKPGVLQPISHKYKGKDEKGWYDTGDIVNIDEDNYLTIVGRAKRFAKIAGEMISLTAVEYEINVIWPDHSNAVVGIPDARKGEALILFTDNKEAKKDEVLKHLKANGISELYLPQEIKYLKDFPVLGSGKIDYVTINSLAKKC